jgi:hypothetical protein
MKLPGQHQVRDFRDKLLKRLGMAACLSAILFFATVFGLVLFSRTPAPR